MTHRTRAIPKAPSTHPDPSILRSTDPLLEIAFINSQLQDRRDFRLDPPLTYDFLPSENEPGEPVRAIEDDHSPVVNWRNFRAGVRRQQRERLPRPGIGRHSKTSPA